MNPVAQEQSVVPLRICGNLAYMPEQCLDAVQAALTFPAATITSNGQGGYIPAKFDYPAYEIIDQEVVTHLGLVPRVLRHLQVQGIPAQVDDQNQWGHLDRIDYSVLNDPQLTRTERILGNAVVDHPRGQVVHEEARDIATFIALMIRLFHQEHVLIVTRNKKTARRLCKDLQRILNRPIALRLSDAWEMKHRIWVCNTYQLDKSRSEVWPVVILADVETATSSTAHNVLPRLDNSLRYVMMPANSPLDAMDRLRVEIFSGGIIYWDPTDADRLDVDVILATVPGPAVRRIREPLARKRTHIWHSHARNRAIAQIAQALARGDTRELLRYGIVLNADHSVVNTTAPPSVAVLVETPQHGRALQEYLPGWELFDKSRGVDPKLTALEFLPDHSIVTVPFASIHAIDKDVVIRTDGTGSPWNASFGPSRCVHEDGMVLVDFMDDFDVRAKQDSQARMREYRNQGWNVVG